MNLAKDQHLGPGTYDVPSTLGKQGGYRFDTKGNYSPSHDVPGPGSYDAKYELVRNSTGGYSIPKGLKTLTERSNSCELGPGQYIKDTSTLNKNKGATIRGTADCQEVNQSARVK